MAIVEAMKKYDIRLSVGNTWMYYDEDEMVWVVLNKEYGKKKNKTLYKGTDESEAVEALLK